MFVVFLQHCNLLLVLWAESGRINETLLDREEMTHMVYQVIFSPVSSYLVVFPPLAASSRLTLTSLTGDAAVVMADRRLTPLSRLKVRTCQSAR